MKLTCPRCHKEMIWFMDTLLCPVCGWEQLWYLKHVRDLIKDPKAWNKFK